MAMFWYGLIRFSICGGFADNLSLLILPPYGPELNPVENVWQHLRANWLVISGFDSYNATLDGCCSAWNRFADDPKTIT